VRKGSSPTNHAARREEGTGIRATLKRSHTLGADNTRTCKVDMAILINAYAIIDS
jgi:hypothetical protein